MASCGSRGGKLREDRRCSYATGRNLHDGRSGESPQALHDAAWTAVLYDARSAPTLSTDARWQHPEKSAIEFVLAFAKALLE